MAISHFPLYINIILLLQFKHEDFGIAKAKNFNFTIIISYIFCANAFLRGAKSPRD